MIAEDIVPYAKMFENCSFEALEDYFEMSWKIQRAKLRALRKSGGTMFGPERVSDSRELERRRAWPNSPGPCISSSSQPNLFWTLSIGESLINALQRPNITDKRLEALESNLLRVILYEKNLGE
jgi:hypothetical protein